MQFLIGFPRNTQSKSFMLSLSMPGNSNIVHCGILFDMPYQQHIHVHVIMRLGYEHCFMTAKINLVMNFILIKMVTSSNKSQTIM